MNIKRPDWFTLDQLADHWGIHRHQIDFLIETRQLRACARYIHDDIIGEEWTCSTMEKETFDDDCAALNNRGYKRTTISHNGQERIDIFIRLEEVERFEKEHTDQLTKGMTPKEKKIFEGKNQEEFCITLKNEGLSNLDMAKKLTQAFPEISPFRLGRLIVATGQDTSSFQQPANQQ